MNKDNIKNLLVQISKGEVSVEEGLLKLKDLPYEDIGVAHIDHHRSLRRGLTEVIFGEGKDITEILSIMDRISRQGENIIVTRLDAGKADAISRKYPDAGYHERSRVLTLLKQPVKIRGKGTILVISAGTSDIPVAEEAALTARFMGNEVDTIYDLGVSGLHRLLGHREQISKASVLIVVAGMEGALPSVVGGLVACPIIAVPTSVGYGTALGGFTALMSMLTSCASGVTVVNIDNGFGAAMAVHRMLPRAES